MVVYRNVLYSLGKYGCLKTININLRNSSPFIILSCDSCSQRGFVLDWKDAQKAMFAVLLHFLERANLISSRTTVQIFHVYSKCIPYDYSLCSNGFQSPSLNDSSAKVSCGRIVEYKNLYSHCGRLQRKYLVALTLLLLKETNEHFFVNKSNLVHNLNLFLFPTCGWLPGMHPAYQTVIHTGWQVPSVA